MRGNQLVGSRRQTGDRKIAVLTGNYRASDVGGNGGEGQGRSGHSRARLIGDSPNESRRHGLRLELRGGPGPQQTRQREDSDQNTHDASLVEDLTIPTAR